AETVRVNSSPKIRLKRIVCTSVRSRGKLRGAVARACVWTPGTGCCEDTTTLPSLNRARHLRMPRGRGRAVTRQKLKGRLDRSTRMVDASASQVNVPGGDV